MATTLLNDMKVYDPRTQSGYVETLQQNIEAFNAASQGCIRLSTVSKQGQFDLEAFIANTSGLERRRTPDVNDPVSSIKLVQSEIVKVKLNRGIGPVEYTLDALRKSGVSEGAFRFAIGEQAARATTAGRLNISLAAAAAALDGNEVKHEHKDGSNFIKLDHHGLIDGMAKFGDASNRISCWVMHSKPYFDLVHDQITKNILGVSGFVLAEARPVTMNRPVIVTDSESLKVTIGADQCYVTLGLVPGGIEIEDTEQEVVMAQILTGLQNITVRLQGEYAFNLGVRGFTWDVQNGGANPTDASLKDSANWNAAFSSHKDFAGVKVVSL